MIKITVILILLFLSIATGIQLKYDPGYILIAINHWTIETTIGVGILSLMLLFALLYALFVLFNWLWHIPASLCQWKIKRATQKTQQSIYYDQLLTLIKHNQEHALSHFIKNLPKKCQCDPAIVARVSQYLLENNKDKEAEVMLRHCLQKKYNEEVMNVYGLIQHDKMSIAFVESLLKKNPHSPALYLCLGRINQSKQLWGKARTYLEKSIALAPNAAAFLQLGLLLEKLDHPSEALAVYKAGLSARKNNYMPL